MSRRGSSLVEVLVALAILELGLLGVVGLLVTASRVLARAAMLERSLVLAGRVADSLAAEPEVADGELRVDSLVVRWVREPAGAAVRVRPTASDRTTLELYVPLGGGK